MKNFVKISPDNYNRWRPSSEAACFGVKCLSYDELSSSQSLSIWKLKKILLGGFPLHLFWKILAGSQLVDTASNFTKNMEKKYYDTYVHFWRGQISKSHYVESKIHKIVRIPKSWIYFIHFRFSFSFMIQLFSKSIFDILSMNFLIQYMSNVQWYSSLLSAGLISNIYCNYGRVFNPKKLLSVQISLHFLFSKYFLASNHNSSSVCC